MLDLRNKQMREENPTWLAEFSGTITVRLLHFVLQGYWLGELLNVHITTLFPFSKIHSSFGRLQSMYIEDITWPFGDKKFLFSCWKIFHEWAAHTNVIPDHFTYYNFFEAEGAIYYVAIATVFFSHVKMTYYFYVWRHHVFAQKLT